MPFKAPLNDKQKSEKILNESSQQFSKGNFKSAKLLMDTFLDDLGNYYSVKSISDSKMKRKLHPKASIIVVTYQHSDEFLDLLTSLKPYSENKDYEIIIVTNDNETSANFVAKFINNYTLVEISINVGASIARNLGAQVALGNNLIFIDDDGNIAENSIETLIECKEKHDAVSVRGKIELKTPGSQMPTHYDRGKFVIPSIQDIEGFVVWDKKAFMNVGGFDPLLWGHEGLHLMLKAFRFYSPLDFLYCPDAIFYHDFDQNPDKTGKKLERHDYNSRYIKYCGYDLQKHIRIINSYASDVFFSEIFNFKSSFRKNYLPYRGNELISVITTAKNAESFLQDYTLSLKNQTYQNFEIIFVDDGSKDNTYKTIKNLWKNDARLKVVRLSKNNGRSNALNKAISAARGSILLIHDVDDISVPTRFELTASVFNANKEISCLSFFMFNEREEYLVARPFVSDITSIRARRFFGMPVGFPTFAFRKEFAKLKFDSELHAGVDCEWLHKNFEAHDTDGMFIPLPMVYYRIHEGQITSQKRKTQDKVALDCILDLHRKYIGDEVDKYIQIIQKLSNLIPLESGNDIHEIQKYFALLKRKIRNHEIHDISRVYTQYLDYGRHELAVKKLRLDYNKLRENHHKLLEQSGGNRKRRRVNWTIRERIFYPFVLPFVKSLATPHQIELYKKRPIDLFSILKPQKYRFFGRLLFGLKYNN